jgi:hypothetical protein
MQVHVALPRVMHDAMDAIRKGESTPAAIIWFCSLQAAPARASGWKQAQRGQQSGRQIMLRDSAGEQFLKPGRGARRAIVVRRVQHQGDTARSIGRSLNPDGVLDVEAVGAVGAENGHWHTVLIGSVDLRDEVIPGLGGDAGDIQREVRRCGGDRKLLCPDRTPGFVAGNMPW